VFGRDNQGSTTLNLSVRYPLHCTAIMLGVLFCFGGCRNSLDEVADFEMLGDGASQSIRSAQLEYSVEGVPTHRLNAANMQRSSEENATWAVSGGFQMEVLEKDGMDGAFLSAQSGTFAEESRFLKAEGDVVLMGEGGDTLHTELLYWSADSDRVHTPAPVEVRTPEGILRGTGLESDARFSRYRILRPTGIFLIDTTKTNTP